MDSRIEGRIRALGRFHRQCTGDQRGLQDGFDLEQTGQGAGGGKLGAVEQGQPFLCAQHARLQLRMCKRVGSRQTLRADEGLANADHRRSQMRQRCQIAGSAHRALARHHRRDAGAQHRVQQCQRVRLHAGRALGQAGELECHHQPYHRHRRGLAHACRMREHDIALQGLQILALDTHAGQLAEAGVDAIHRLATRHDGLHRLRAAQHRSSTCIVQRDFGTAIQRTPLRQRDLAGLQDNRNTHDDSGFSTDARATRGHEED